MGMAASQARFLGLTARQNNVEFEGQQINQQRTLLSNESANYYNDLLGMTVPTPPSVDAYTKTVYTFSDGALTNTVTSMIAQTGGRCTVSYLSKWQDDYAVVSAATSVVTRNQVSSSSSSPSYVYSVGSSKLRALGSYDGEKRVEETITVDGQTYTVHQDGDGYYIEKTENKMVGGTDCSEEDIENFEYYLFDNEYDSAVQYYKDDTGKFYYLDDDENPVYPDTPVTENDLVICLYDEAQANSEYAVSLVTPDENAEFGYTKEVLTETTEKEYLTDSQIDSITVYDADKDSVFYGLTSTEISNMLKEEAAWAELLRQKYGDTDWFVRYVTDMSVGTKKPYFYSENDLENATYDTATSASLSNINCYTTGSEQKIAEFKGVENCIIEKDSSGRLITLSIPKEKDDGSIVYTDYALTTESVTDQEAYDNAMNQYEYDKYLYDQAIEHINAKIEIIQAEDKNLELRLKQLDTEQKAISTEKEAVQKVIQENTKDTFKIFNA